MKKIILFLVLLFSTISCFAEKVGDKIYYRNANFEFNRVDTYITKVQKDERENYYLLEITSIICPGGGSSIVGVFTFTTNYCVKEKDKIILYQLLLSSIGFTIKPTTLVITKLSDNEVEFSTMQNILNEE